MDENSSPGRDTDATELGAAEASAPLAFWERPQETAPPSDRSKEPERDAARPATCPNCGRRVEAGFKFCDGCGSRLESTVPSKPVVMMGEPVAPRSERQVLSTRVPGAPGALEVPESRPPLLERLRERRRERARIRQAEKALIEPKVMPAAEVQAEAPVGSPEALSEPPARPPAEPAPKPDATTAKVAEREPVGQIPLHAIEVKPAAAPKAGPAGPSRRVLIAKRLRWRQEAKKSRAAVVPSAPRLPVPDSPTWRPVSVTVKRPAFRRPSPRAVGLYVGHLVVAFVTGAVVLGALTIAAAVASGGEIAVLETRGLPIFIGGATAIVVFAIVRTSGPRRRDLRRARRATVLSVLGGICVLAVAAGLLYQPSVSARVQQRIERAVGVFGSADTNAVNAFDQDIDAWNRETTGYQDLVEQVAGGEKTDADLNRFREDVTASEVKLEQIIGLMRTHASEARHADLRDGLDDLASIFEDRLAGLRLVSRGLLIDDIGLIQSGDARFKEAKQRADALFDDRLRPLLGRAGVDADSFGTSLAGAG